MGSGSFLRLACSVEGLTRFHHEAKQSVGVIFMRLGRKATARRGDGQCAQQLGVAYLSLAKMNHDPEMRYQVAMKGPVALQAGSDRMQRFVRARHTVGLQEKILQLRDLMRVARRYFFQL
jgi:hypothetical protein